MAELDRPIFVVGCAKSGTTLLGSLLAMHPDVGPRNIVRQWGEGLVDALVDVRQRHRVAVELEQRDVWSRYFSFDTELFVGAELTDLHNPLDAIRTAQLVRDLTVHLREPRYLSKQPSNTFRVHALREIFPGCKLVAIHRDGRDVVASWGRNDRWQALGGHRRAIELMARKWNECIDHIEACRQELDLLTLGYEELMDDVPATMQRVLEHCDLNPAPGLYDEVRPRDRTGSWVEIIPAEFHGQVEESTLRNRTRLGYLRDRFSMPRPLPARTGAQAAEGGSFRDAPKSMVPCAGCSGTDFQTLTAADRHGLGLCTAMCNCCGLVQTNPRPPDEWYGSFYRHDFWPLYVGDRVQSPAERFVSDNQERKGRQVGMALLRAFDRTRVRFLDIGCGLGGLAAFLAEQRPGWDITVLDPSREAVDFVQGKLGLRGYSTPLEELPALGNFDLIAMVHVLEHTLHPVDVLRRAGGMLAEDGLLYVEVPDLMSRCWHGPGFFHVAHSCSFDQLTLQRVIERAGLHVRQFIPGPVREDWPWAIGAFIGRMPGGGVAPVPATADGDELRRRREWVAARMLTPDVHPEPRPSIWYRMASRLPGPVRGALGRLRRMRTRG